MKADVAIFWAAAVHVGTALRLPQACGLRNDRFGAAVPTMSLRGSFLMKADVAIFWAAAVHVGTAGRLPQACGLRNDKTGAAPLFPTNHTDPKTSHKKIR